MKKVKIKGEDIDVSEDTYTMVETLRDLTNAINRWRTSGSQRL